MIIAYSDRSAERDNQDRRVGDVWLNNVLKTLRVRVQGLFRGHL